MSPEPFDSRAKAPPAKRWEKGCGDENASLGKTTKGGREERPWERGWELLGLK